MQKQTEVAEFRHRALLVQINRTFREGASVEELYEVTRCCWRVDKSRAEKAEVILAVYRGEIKAAFIADKWQETTPPGRFEFSGHEASSDIQELYVGKRVPDEYRGQGHRYTYEWSGKMKMSPTARRER